MAYMCITQGWSYPTSMYFCYVFFLSIGYGDWAPITPAGRGKSHPRVYTCIHYLTLISSLESSLLFMRFLQCKHVLLGPALRPC